MTATHPRRPAVRPDPAAHPLLAGALASTAGVFVRLTYIDAAKDLAAGVLLSQIVYWHSPDAQNESKLTVEHDGHLWLAKGYEDWWKECRISGDAARRLLQKLTDSGLIHTEVRKFRGAPTCHIRLDHDGMEAAMAAVDRDADGVPPRRWAAGSGEPARSPNRRIRQIESADSPEPGIGGLANTSMEQRLRTESTAETEGQHLGASRRDDTPTEGPEAKPGQQALIPDAVVVPFRARPSVDTADGEAAKVNGEGRLGPENRQGEVNTGVEPVAPAASSSAATAWLPPTRPQPVPGNPDASLTDTLVAWAADVKHVPAPAGNPVVRHEHALMVLRSEMGPGHPQYNRCVLDVVCEYDALLTGKRLQPSARGHLATLVNAYSAEDALSAMGEAATSGAGLDGGYEDDPRARVKYATAILKNRYRARRPATAAQPARNAAL